jgi:hypothetical protein
MVGQVKSPCQAVAVRFVADTRTDEFLNIGVVLFCPVRQYASARFLSSWARISYAFPTADLVHLRRLKRLFEKSCEGWVAGTQQPQLFAGIGSLDGLLGAVVAFDDATIRFSQPISGLTANPEATLAELFRLYVGKDDDEGIVEGRDDETVWRELVKLTTPQVVQLLTRHTLRSAHYEQVFERSWKNGVWNAAQPLSFDMRDPQSIREKALLWSSKIRELRPAENDTAVHFLVGLPHDNRPKDVRRAARDAFEILSDTIRKDDGRVLPESKAGDLARKIAEDLGQAVG